MNVAISIAYAGTAIIACVLAFHLFRVWRCEKNGHAWNLTPHGMRCERCRRVLRDGESL